jgi:N-acyl-L-homoserine lactone synthetase
MVARKQLPHFAAVANFRRLKAAATTTAAKGAGAMQAGAMSMARMAMAAMPRTSQIAAQDAPEAFGESLPQLLHAFASGNRRGFESLFRAMYADRKTVFVDQLGWKLPITDAAYEIDEYDGEDAVYLIVADAVNGSHLGSVRLLPTMGPHLLGDKFAGLCTKGVPRGADIFEITRMVTRPGLASAPARQVREKLAVAIAEFAIAHGITRFTMMTHMRFLPAVMAMGWDCEPLGMPQSMDGVDVAAIIVGIDADTLARFRVNYQIGAPLLRLPPIEIGTGGVSAF